MAINKYFILRDTRLLGSISSLKGIYMQHQVDATTPLSQVFAQINSAAKWHGKLQCLYILCHGYGTGPDFDLLWRGGMGLQLGKEDLDTTNVSNWSAIKDSVSTIVVHACGAAYTGPSIMSPGTSGTGQSLMTELSKNTNAVVFAADTLQYYTLSNLNFGEWEGTVYMFTPSGVTLPKLAPETDNIW